MVCVPFVRRGFQEIDPEKRLLHPVQAHRRLCPCRSRSDVPLPSVQFQWILRVGLFILIVEKSSF